MTKIESVMNSSSPSLGPAPHPSAANPTTNQSYLSKRVQSITSNAKVFDGYPAGAWEHLAKHVVKNTHSCRRNLKSKLEEDLLNLHGNFNAEYESRVSGYLERTLNSVCMVDQQLTESIDQLLANRERIGTAIDKSSIARSELEQREHKLDVLTKFKKLFVVDQEAAYEALESGDLLKLTQFASELQKLRSNCQVLLREVPNAVLALESLDVSVEVLEKVYERVFQEVSKSSVSVLPREVLRKSLSLLQERPHLFHEALLAISRSLCDSHASEFLHVLTRTDGGLEVSTFDSVKFLSDMLSWLLDLSVSEKESMESVLESVRGSTWSVVPVKPKLEYLDVILSGVVELVESRFSSIVKSTFGVMELFKLSRVLSFYSAKMRFVAGQTTKDALSSMHHSAWSSFLLQWESRAQSERSALLLTRSGLSPLPFVTETVYLLETVLAIHADSWKLDGDEEENGDEEDLFLLLSAGIDPLIQTCVQVATSSGMNEVESSVFLLNCLATLQGPLRKHAFASESVNVIAALMNMQMDSLVESTSKRVFEKAGLAEPLEKIRNGDKNFHLLSISSSLKSFYSLLFTQGVAAVSHTDALVSRELRAEARNAIGKSISDAYEEIFSATESLGIATHTPDQVRALLDV